MLAPVARSFRMIVRIVAHLVRMLAAAWLIVLGHVLGPFFLFLFLGAPAPTGVALSTNQARCVSTARERFTCPRRTVSICVLRDPLRSHGHICER